MNEMTCAQNDGNMWNGVAFEYDVDIIRNFNQLFVNTVRSTGSNNTKRWLASKGHFAFTRRIEMPIDPLNDGVSHQMYSAHIYNSVENRYKGIKELADNYKDLGCPLILGEWTTYTSNDGSTATGYNDVEKAFQSELVYKYARVKTVIDDVRALKKQESKEKSEDEAQEEKTEAEQEDTAKTEETEAPTEESGGSDITVIVGVIAAAAIAAALIIITVIIRQKRKPSNKQAHKNNPLYVQPNIQGFTLLYYSLHIPI